ncbi:MAG: uroporphyrinogen-III synthase [Nitrososphaerota archaeon]|nr:uroporphyrinogen-III synthase [Nitrososphaerota archaeon]MDG7023689.1 uroporphyrinogen-III synthase [Nitrososphaerota archaeon]
MRPKDASGPRVVIARSAEGNRELSPRIRDLGMVPISISTVEFLQPSDLPRVNKVLAGVADFDWVVLTSPRGASTFVRMIRKVRAGGGGDLPRIAAVGEVTAVRLRREGFEAAFVPSEYTTAALGRQLPTGSGRRILLLRAEKAGEEIVSILEGRGFSVTSVPIYRTSLVGSRYRGAGVEGARAVLLGSPSEVEGLIKRLAPAVLARLKTDALAICIGPVTANEARDAGFERVVASRVHTFDALLMEAGKLVVR